MRPAPLQIGWPGAIRRDANGADRGNGGKGAVEIVFRPNNGEAHYRSGFAMDIRLPLIVKRRHPTRSISRAKSWPARLLRAARRR
jgi:hypothetical protein